MHRNFGQKLKAIRMAEGYTQSAFASMVGIGLGSIKNYETGREVGLSIINRVLDIERFQKYTLWLMIDKTSEGAGQISPPLAHTSPAETESPQLTNRAG